MKGQPWGKYIADLFCVHFDVIYTRLVSQENIETYTKIDVFIG